MIPGDFQLPKTPDRKKLALFGALGVVGLAGFIGTVLVTTFLVSAWLGRPIVFGYDEGPTQPIAFPHTVHAGTGVLLDVNGNPRLDDQEQVLHGLGLDCVFCHRNVTEGAAASIPAVGLCMSCHATIGDDIDEVKKLQDIFDDGRSIDWIRVHRVPDHVHFVHEAHIRFFSGPKTVVDKVRDAGQQIKLSDARKISPDATVGESLVVPASAVCSTCHGEVGTMTKVKQIRSLKMKDCVDCHRDAGAPTDCTTCHY